MGLGRPCCCGVSCFGTSLCQTDRLCMQSTVISTMVELEQMYFVSKLLQFPSYSDVLMHPWFETSSSRWEFHRAENPYPVTVPLSD